MDKLLDILKNDPDYTNFTLDGQVIPLEDYLEVRPETNKEIVNYVKEKYPMEKFEFSVNTNATLINEEIARFLVHNFRGIGISIDGYRETNNKTRIYNNGKGSFDDALRGWRLLNKYRSKPEKTYQGTLIPRHDFDINNLIEMKEYGFTSARLGVDVLNITQKEAKQMAELSFNMSIKSKDIGLHVIHGYCYLPIQEPAVT